MSTQVDMLSIIVFLGLHLLWASLGFNYYSEPHHLVYIFSVPSFCLSDNNNNLWISFSLQTRVLLLFFIHCARVPFLFLGFFFFFFLPGGSKFVLHFFGTTGPIKQHRGHTPNLLENAFKLFSITMYKARKLLSKWCVGVIFVSDTDTRMTPVWHAYPWSVQFKKYLLDLWQF